MGRKNGAVGFRHRHEFVYICMHVCIHVDMKVLLCAAVGAAIGAGVSHASPGSATIDILIEIPIITHYRPFHESGPISTLMGYRAQNNWEN